MFEKVLQSVKHSLRGWLALPQGKPRNGTGSRLYNMAKQSRLTVGWGTTTSSEDSELLQSLTQGRNRSRQLIRDAAYAKRAKVIVQNNIIGQGIGMQAAVANTRGTLNAKINDDIERVWKSWTNKSQCHTGRTLHFSEFERAVIGQTFEAGEVFIRMYNESFVGGPVPFTLELIEAERIADDIGAPGPVNGANIVKLGIEVDRFGAPVNYMIRTIHPGDIRLDSFQRSEVEIVPASQILHLRIVDRWPQTRAMPWLHAAARKLNDMDGLTEAEITAARAAACYMGFIETPTADAKYGEEQEDGSIQTELEPAMIERLNAGEKFTFAAPNRPNTQLDPFMRMMLREVAAGSGSSYESLSRDYSQSNYSSSRLALIDDRDLWRTLQAWFIREFREEIHLRWLQQAVLAGAIPAVPLREYAVRPEKYQAVRFKPRGWSWIDPAKEVEAYTEAIKAGFMTVSQVIALTGSGLDLEDVLEERRNELDLMEEADLVFSTDPKILVAETMPEATPPSGGEKADDEGDDETPEGQDPNVKMAEKMLRRVRK